jgi:hypothetical protein
LDETGQGLMGNLALVVELEPLARLGQTSELLGVLGGVARACLPAEYVTPLTLRFRLERSDAGPGTAESEVRFKVRIPRGTIARGGGAVASLAARAVEGFERVLRASELAPYTRTYP